MPSIFRNYGLAKHSNATDVAQNLKNRFKNGRNPNATRSVFLGVEALRNLVSELDAGNFDGLQVSFGKSTTNEIVLVAQQWKLDISTGDSSEVVERRGEIYMSIQTGETEPPVAKCPRQLCND